MPEPVQEAVGGAAGQLAGAAGGGSEKAQEAVGGAAGHAAEAAGQAQEVATDAAERAGDAIG